MSVPPFIPTWVKTWTAEEACPIRELSPASVSGRCSGSNASTAPSRFNVFGFVIENIIHSENQGWIKAEIVLSECCRGREILLSVKPAVQQTPLGVMKASEGIFEFIKVPEVRALRRAM